MRPGRRLAFVVSLMIGVLFLYQCPEPSNDRDWTEDQKCIPSVQFSGQSVHIKNIRDFRYRSADDYNRNFVSRALNLSSVKTVDFILSQFASWRGLAHAFLSFGYETDDGIEYLAISVEIRKERGEAYSPILGMLKQYELAYIVATEQDVIALRTHHRREPVYLYPLKVSPSHAQQLLRNMLMQVQALQTKPEFYHTLFNSCMSNIAKHANAIKPGLIPFGWNTIFPGLSDGLAVQLQFIDTPHQDIEKIRNDHRIDQWAQKHSVDSNFSQIIRQTARNKQP